MDDDNQANPRVRLVFQTDFDDFRWTHLISPEAYMLTYQDFPKPLRYRLRPIVCGLSQNRIARLHFDSHLAVCALADQRPFDLSTLHRQENFVELFELVGWWIRREQRLFVVRPNKNGAYPHPTWTCECGTMIPAQEDRCPDILCPSNKKLVRCTGNKSKRFP